MTSGPVKLGIFGGTFNPIHFGHLRAAEEAREIAGLDKVLFIPSGTPPLKSADLISPLHRYRMAEAAVRGNRSFGILDIECSRRGKSYTVRTVEVLQKTFPHADLYFLLGIDAFLDIPNWWNPDRLISMTNFIVLSRPGSLFADLVRSPYLLANRGTARRIDAGELSYHAGRLTSGKEIVLAAVTPLGVSSTEIRERVRRETSIKYLLPPQVESYIISQGLYRKRKMTAARGRRRRCT